MIRAASVVEAYRHRRSLRAEQEIADIEGYADPASLDPARRPPPKRRLLGAVALSALALSTASALVSVPEVEGYIMPSDRQERLIEDGARKAVGGKYLKVTCIADARMNVVGKTGPKSGAGHWRNIWLAQSTCDAITSSIDKPIAAADLDQKVLSETTEAQIRAMGTAGHELGHAALNIRSEPDAECTGLQLGPKIATAYGMSPGLESSMQEWLLETMTQDHQSTDPRVKEHAFDATSCRSGGGADLASRGLGLQEHFPG